MEVYSDILFYFASFQLYSSMHLDYFTSANQLGCLSVPVLTDQEAQPKS